MLLEPNVLEELLEPGSHRMMHTLFKVDDEFAQRIQLVSEAFEEHLNELLIEVIGSGDISLIDEPALLIRVWNLMRELVRPLTFNEAMYCANRAGIMAHLACYSLTHRARYILDQTADNKDLTYYGPTTATA